MKKDLRLVFMGTPDFAVESLRRLVEGGYNVVAVVTMPDKPIGRHQNILQSSPVKKYAEEQHIPVLQPEKLKDETFLEQLRSYNADLQIVVAFRMLPELVWNMPRLGTFNLHASLLPQYRGAAPINWAIINGETVTGNTTFFLTHEIDTGAIIQQQTVEIGEEDNVETLHDRLMSLGGNMVVETVNTIAEGTVKTTAQEQLTAGATLHAAPKIFKETCKIDWCKSAKQIYDFIRGLSPYPVAWTELLSPSGEKIILKIFDTQKEIVAHNLNIGTLHSDGKTYLKVAVTDGYISILSLQPAGRKRMAICDFLRGFRGIEMLKIDFCLEE